MKDHETSTAVSDWNYYELKDLFWNFYTMTHYKMKPGHQQQKFHGVNSENILNEKNRILMKNLKNKCVRCGEDIDKKHLRCKDCIHYVDQEIKGETERPLIFYFRFYKSF